MQIFSRPVLIPCTPFFAQQDHLGGIELRYRLSQFHEHLPSLPCLAQVLSLVGWPKLVQIFCFLLGASSQEWLPAAVHTPRGQGRHVEDFWSSRFLC